MREGHLSWYKTGMRQILDGGHVLLRVVDRIDGLPNSVIPALINRRVEFKRITDSLNWRRSRCLASPSRGGLSAVETVLQVWSDP